MTINERRRALMSMGGGNAGKTLKKLASVTIDAQTGRSITINATDEIRASETLYLVFDNVVCSAADWIYVSLNNTSTSAGQSIGYTSKGDTFNDAYPICRTKTTDISTKTQTPYMMMFAGSVGSKNNASTFNALCLNLYTSGNTFTSGTVEIWGWV